MYTLLVMRFRSSVGIALVAACGKAATAPPPSPTPPAPVVVDAAPPDADSAKAAAAAKSFTDPPSSLAPEGYSVDFEPATAQGAPPPARIGIASKSASTATSLTADAVLAKITSVYLAGVERCYRLALATDPTARGKLQLAIAVDTTGRSSVKVTAFDDALASCVSDHAARWVFPPPTRDGAPAEAAFDIVLQLNPES